jgi:hypothetical protein
VPVDSDEYLTSYYLAMTTLCTVVPGVSLGLLLFLIRARYGLGNRKAMQRLWYLYGEFRRDCCYWEPLVVMNRKVLMAAGAVLGGGQSEPKLRPPALCIPRDLARVISIWAAGSVRTIYMYFRTHLLSEECQTTPCLRCIEKAVN